jgi:hypothetical protein
MDGTHLSAPNLADLRAKLTFGNLNFIREVQLTILPWSLVDYQIACPRLGTSLDRHGPRSTGPQNQVLFADPYSKR